MMLSYRKLTKNVLQHSLVHVAVEKTTKVNRHTVKQKYSTVTQCKCLLSQSGCSDACRCKNCSNPCGKKATVAVKSPRNRYRHEWQNCTPGKSVEFTKSREEKITIGPFTTEEYFVLVNILDFSEENGLEMDTLTILNIVLAISTKIDAINLRNEQNFMEMYKTNLAIMCENQLQCNITEIPHPE